MRRLFAVFASATVAGALLASVSQAPAEAAYSVTGVDVSSYQHPSGKSINWAKVAQTEDFAIVKATEGMSGNYDNSWFATDFDAAKRNGMVVGSYHFADAGRPVKSDALGEARHYWDVIRSRDGKGVLPPVLDIESAKGLTKAELRSWVTTFMAEISKLSGRTPILYTYPSFWNTHLATNALSQYPLWIAHYTTGSPTIPGGWSSWRMWQYTSKGTVNGIPTPGKLDRNYFNGTLAQLRSWANGASTPSPTPKLRNGKCESGEFCYYYNTGLKGSVSDLPAKLGNYGDKQPGCYDYKGAGAGKGQCIKNNAAAVWNRTKKTVRVYYNSNFGGKSIAIKPGAKVNLKGSCCYNENASHRPV